MEMFFRELQKYPENAPFKFEETLDIKQELLDRYADQVIDAEKFTVSGSAFADQGDVIVNYHVTGKLVVPSSRSLMPVDLPMEFDVEEFYVPSKAAESRYPKDTVVFVLDEEDKVEITDSVIDNVILNIPMQVLAESELEGQEDMPSGDDWEVMTADDFDKNKAELETVDPRLAKLKDLFPEDNQED
ncbi:DUF177 domain-containing protein [Lentilactobacillus kosonis]|uniref:Protein in cluster with ribosomal protein L32p n=1 Tax=Lentilactobacillus kosonis TaxID=2810561 RepID=A0A401FKF9_9LACO|nr:DUF177 domain-containing protein [Lentilactobacillus kosonis]GAY72852.1 protein in cluster with ribosomal protein L32p [Lentilactobacillus kosonis]